MIIDMHAHAAHFDLYPNVVLENIKDCLRETILQDTGIKIKSQLLSNLVKNTLNDADCSRLIQQMAEAHIEKTVLLILDFSYGIDFERKISIEEIHCFYHAILQRHPDKFRVFSGIDPRRGRSGLELFEKSIVEFNFCGLKLYPPMGFELDDRTLFPFLELCEFYKLPVLTHTGSSFNGMHVSLDYPSSILKISKQFNNTAFILGHAGFLDFENSISIASQRDNVYLEISGFQKLMHEADLIEQRLRILTTKLPERILFGTDWPMFSISGVQKDWVDFFISIWKGGEDILERFFYKNAKEILPP